MTLTELATALIIVATLQEARFWRSLSAPYLAYLGRLSYAIYLFHYPIMVYLRSDYDWVVTIAWGGAAAVALAALSYHTIEAAVRHHRKRSVPHDTLPVR